MLQKYMRHLLPLTGEKILGAKEGKTPLNTYSDELSYIYIGSVALWGILMKMGNKSVLNESSTL